jgi:hypothetical protein
MFLNGVALITAVSISAVAAYYSIVGLTAIFAGVFWPIVIMGTVLEVGKIITTVWLHTYWRDLRWFLKAYMSVAVLVLMFITSMGIFGFLSRAHIEVTSQAGSSDLLIRQIDQSIALEQKRIEDSRAVIAQLDGAVQSLLQGSASNAVRDNNRTAQLTQQATKLRQTQKKERDALTATIDEANKRIGILNQDKLKLEQSRAKIEAEVGPIKYIAQLIYGNNINKDLLEEAVRWVIIVIVAVFDPLAVCMVLGVTMVINARKRKKEEEIEANTIIEEKIVEVPVEKIVEKVVEVPVEKIVTQAVPIISNNPELEAERDQLKERADKAEQELAEALVMLEQAKAQEPVVVERVVEVPVEKVIEIEKPVEIVKEIEKPVEVIREVTVENTETINKLEDEIRKLVKEIEDLNVKLAATEPTEVETAQQPLAPNLLQALSIQADDASAVPTTTFGSDFPANPQKNQMFLKLDVMPSQLFKYNGNKWIMVDKSQNTSYANDQKVVAMLLDKLNSGEIEWDDLTEAEQDSVRPYIARGQRGS